ncbi:hypothetical protein HK096_003990, partial [Nowakowskiella sp. JEL0078]
MTLPTSFSSSFDICIKFPDETTDFDGTTCNMSASDFTWTSDGFPASGSQSTTTKTTTSSTKTSTTTTKTSTTSTKTTTKASSTTSSSKTTSTSSSSSCAAKYGQCGGSGFTGPTCCVSGST